MVIYLGVLLTGPVRLDLWYKDQNSPFYNSFSINFSLFQLETKNCSYKQFWPFYMVFIPNIFWKKKLYKKPCNFEPFCYVINCYWEDNIILKKMKF